MTRTYSVQRSRAQLGVLLLFITVGLTAFRAYIASAPLKELAKITQLHAQGQASDVLLANVQYHAIPARESFEARWTLTGYATHAVLGGALGLWLIVSHRRPRDAA